MKKVITMVLYNRPGYTREVFEALSRCEGIQDYLILPRIEPGNEEVISIAKSVDFADVRVHVNPSPLGIGTNTYNAWEAGFREADFIIHVEDDTVPAPDCLKYMEHCCGEYENDPEIFSVASYHRQPCAVADHYSIARRSAYICWLVGIWNSRWTWAKNHWSPSSERYATHLANEVKKAGFKEVFPLLSRSQNIGAEGGVHVPSPEWHAVHQHTKHWAGDFGLKAGNYFECRRPRVTAIMVTGTDTEKYALARFSIECFKKQTYSNTELIVINHGQKSLFCGDRRIKEYRIVKERETTFEELWALGVKLSGGNNLINWPPTCWSEPRRIEIQADKRTEPCITLLGSRVCCDWKNKIGWIDMDPGGLSDTALTLRAGAFANEGLSGSETGGHLLQRVVLDNDPCLVIELSEKTKPSTSGKTSKTLSTSFVQADLSTEQQLKVSEIVTQYLNFKHEIISDPSPEKW